LENKEDCPKGKEAWMIIIVEGQAQIHYNGSWEQIAHDLEVLYPTENYTSINVYGLIFEINDIMDVIAAADYIVNNFGDY
jgi:hypothetical protein